MNGVDKKEFVWNDAFWDNMYNGAAKKFAEVKGEGVTLVSSSSDSSDDDEPRYRLKIIKAKRALIARSDKSKSIKKK